jgi:hypothetical protein
MGIKANSFRAAKRTWNGVASAVPLAFCSDTTLEKRHRIGLACM